MQRHFDEVLKDLTKDILKMGAYAEEAIYKSIEALKGRDKEIDQAAHLAPYLCHSFIGAWG